MSTFLPSKLGTQEHWNSVYDEEIQNFAELGDEGEIWFGEDSMNKMVDWTLRNAPPPRSILEIGSGNGLLLCELAQKGYDQSQIAGIDYSSGSTALSQQVARGRAVDGITFDLCDFLTEDPPLLPGMRGALNSWDVLLDKGTFDAISLAEKDASGVSPRDIYPKRVSRLLRQTGFFLITSCNFTEDELKEHFATNETGLRYHTARIYSTKHIAMAVNQEAYAQAWLSRNEYSKILSDIL